MTVREPVSRTFAVAIDAAVARTAKIYAERSGKPLDAKAMVFVRDMLTSIIDLTVEGAKSGGNVTPRKVAQLAAKRALATAGLMTDEASMAACVVATISLSVATVETFGILVGATGISGTGAGAAVGIPVAAAAATFYYFEIEEFAGTCGEAYVASQERKFESLYKAASKRKMMHNFSRNVCEMPQGGSPAGQLKSWKLP